MRDKVCECTYNGVRAARDFDSRDGVCQDLSWSGTCKVFPM